MFASLVGLIHQPGIAIRVPNDDSTFNPKEYPSLAVVTTGKIQGKVRLIHGTEDGSELGMISTRIWVTKEGDKDEVSVRLAFDNKTHTFTLQGPTRFGSFNIYHETTIQIPKSSVYMESLRVEGPNTSFSCDVTDGLTWSSVQSQVSNASIAMESLHADIIDLQTSNSSISGRFEGGHIELTTSNGSISAKLSLLEAQDGRQSTVKTKTANAAISLHVDATHTTKGLWMENTTRNGKIMLGTLLGPASTGSCIKTSTANGMVEFDLDASQTGQPLEVSTKTTNGSIVSSMMVPRYHTFKGVAESSNGSVTVNLTEDFQGRFDLETSNSSAVVEGSNVEFDHDKKNSKRGWRGQGAGEVKISTSNARVNLRIYPTDESVASDSSVHK